ALADPAHLGGRIGLALLHERVVDQAAALQEPAVPLERIVLLPPLDLVRRLVPGGVVGGGVRSQAVGERFDQRRRAVGAGPLRRPIAYPTPCSACEPTGTLMCPNRSSAASYVPPCHVARWNRR